MTQVDTYSPKIEKEMEAGGYDRDHEITYFGEIKHCKGVINLKDFPKQSCILFGLVIMTRL